MSPRAFIVLLAVTVVALVGAIGVVAVQPKLSTNEKINGDPMFATLNRRIAELQKVVVQTTGYKATWENRDGKWVATDHGDYPAKQGEVPRVINGLAAMTKVEPKTDNPGWYQYIRVVDPAGKPEPAAQAAEVAAPAGVRVTASAANGDILADTIVGSVSSTISAAHERGGTFVRNADEPQSWLVEGTITIPGELGGWFDPLMSIPGTSVAGIAVLIGDKTVFEARKPDPKTGHYELVHLDEREGASDSVIDDTTIHNLAAGIVDVNVVDARPLDSVSPGPTARTDRFTTSDGLQLDVTLVEADGDTWAIVKASAPEGSDAAKTAATINALAGNRALKFGRVQTTNLKIDVSRLVEPPGGDAQNPDQGAASPNGVMPFNAPGEPGMPLMPGYQPPGQPSPAPAVPEPSR